MNGLEPTWQVAAGYDSLPMGWRRTDPSPYGNCVPTQAGVYGGSAVGQGLTPVVSGPRDGRRFNHKWTPRFSGQGPTKLDLYLAQFERMAEFNAWDEVEKAANLINSLEGDSLKILRMLPSNAGYHEIVDALLRRFPVVDTVNYEAALARAVRRDGENAAEFAARLEELVERSMPDSTDVHRARVVREKFIKGQPPHIRHPLSLQHPATLAEAVMCVLNFDKLSGYSPPMVGETSECQPKAETLGRWKRQEPGIPARSAKPPSSRQSSN